MIETTLIWRIPGSKSLGFIPLKIKRLCKANCRVTCIEDKVARMEIVISTLTKKWSEIASIKLNFLLGM